MVSDCRTLFSRPRQISIKSYIQRNQLLCCQHASDDDTEENMKKVDCNVVLTSLFQNYSCHRIKTLYQRRISASLVLLATDEDVEECINTCNIALEKLKKYRYGFKSSVQVYCRHLFTSCLIQCIGTLGSKSEENFIPTFLCLWNCWWIHHPCKRKEYFPFDLKADSL